MFNVLRKNGFTLVELMVVVSIIGVLAIVAIPNFLKYQAKSKCSEAKLNLAAMYTSEQSFYTEYDTFASCLSVMAYVPSSESNRRYYISGFSNENAPTRVTAVSKGADCPAMAEGVSSFAATIGTAGFVANTTAFLPSSNNVFEDTFVAGTGGVIQGDKTTAAAADKWTINQSKQIQHVTTGY